MLSGRRLDLLDPSRARHRDRGHRARAWRAWRAGTGRPRRAHFFRRAAFAAGRGAGARARAAARPRPAARGAAARCARIRDRRHDLAVQGGDRRRLQGGRTALARGDPSALRPAGEIGARTGKADQDRRPRKPPFSKRRGSPASTLRKRGASSAVRRRFRRRWSAITSSPGPPKPRKRVISNDSRSFSSKAMEKRDVEQRALNLSLGASLP